MDGFHVAAYLPVPGGIPEADAKRLAEGLIEPSLVYLDSEHKLDQEIEDLKLDLSGVIATSDEISKS